MAEAMRQVRESLGPDAIIVSTHHGGGEGGIHVTAAVEPGPESDPINTDDLEGRLEAQLRERLQSEVEALESGPIPQSLMFHGTPAPLAGRIELASTSLDADTPVLALAGALDSVLRFHPLPDAPETPVMVIGPPGAGKTVTLAKMAARALVAGARVNLITTDTQRTGAIEQIRAYAGLLDSPLETAVDAAELSKELAKTSAGGKAKEGAAKQVILIDTPGTNPYDGGEMSLLKKLMEAGPVESVLVMAAGGDSEEAAEVAAIFARLGARRLLFTRIDTTRRLGSLIAAAATDGLALSDISLTPYIAEGLRPVNPVSLARLILHEREAQQTSDPLSQPDLSKAMA